MIYAFFILALFIALMPCLYLALRHQKTLALLGSLFLIGATGSIYLMQGNPNLESLSPFEMHLKLETIRQNLHKKPETDQNLEALAFIYERLNKFAMAAKVYEKRRTLFGIKPHLLLKELDARLEAPKAFSKENHQRLISEAEKLMPFNPQLDFYRSLLQTH